MIKMKIIDETFNTKMSIKSSTIWYNGFAHVIVFAANHENLPIISVVGDIIWLKRFSFKANI